MVESQSEHRHPAVERAVIAAAGKGTRMLPWTAGDNPKEMLWVNGLPIFDHVMIDLDNAGVPPNMRWGIIAENKDSMLQYYKHHSELERIVQGKGDEAILSHLGRMANYSINWRFQSHKEPSGNARPILDVLDQMEGEPFFALFGDEFFEARPSRTAQMQHVYRTYGRCVVSLMKVDRSLAPNYGMAVLGEEVVEGKVYKLNGLIEKPSTSTSPSDLAGVGGYILTPDITPLLQAEKAGTGGEIVIADAVNTLAQTGDVYGCVIDGEYFDTGTELAYQKTLATLGVRHPDYGGLLIEHFKKLVDERYNDT